MGIHGTCVHAPSTRDQTERKFPRAILRDKNRYPHPEIFDPSRFLTEDGELDPRIPDPIEAFGYGRRICPGRYFALDVLWLSIANILATFKIEKALDERGNVIEPKDEWTTGMFR